MKEYGKDTIEIHKDAIDEKDVVLIHDDLLATGGSMKAAYNLVKKFNPAHVYINFIIELTGEGLNGREVFDEGIEISTAHGTPTRVYSVAKTVADCFKFRNKIGLDVALEALKDAWRTRKLNMTDLAHFAKVNRVEQVMRPYLESIVS